MIGVFLIGLLATFYVFRHHKFARRVQKTAISVIVALNFFMRMSSEERLDAFRSIHRFYPRFVDITVFWFRLVIVYDPEIAKR
jgi:hypothetical protein